VVDQAGSTTSGDGPDNRVPARSEPSEAGPDPEPLRVLPTLCMCVFDVSLYHKAVLDSCFSQGGLYESEPLGLEPANSGVENSYPLGPSYTPS
jgi:hypothetical protein